MIRRSLSAVLALLVTTPLLAAPAGQQTMFNFVRPADVVQVATVDASLPQRFARLRAQFFELGVVQKEAHDDEGSSLLDVRLPRSELNRLVSREGMQPLEFIEEHTLQ